MNSAQQNSVERSASKKVAPHSSMTLQRKEKSATPMQDKLSKGLKKNLKVSGINGSDQKGVGRVSRKSAIINAAGIQFGAMAPARLVKSNSMSRRYFEYALRKSSIRFGVVKRMYHLAEGGLGQKWIQLGKHGKFLVFYHD